MMSSSSYKVAAQQQTPNDDGLTPGNVRSSMIVPRRPIGSPMATNRVGASTPRRLRKVGAGRNHGAASSVASAPPSFLAPVAED
jgi:hypothetical protein